MSRGIASWPAPERPRERLANLGPHSLTDAELLAILLRVGVRGSSAVELGRQILERFGNLRRMAQAPLAALLDIRGVKGAKAAQLGAAMEIARRVALPDRSRPVALGSTARAARYLRERLRNLADEHFRVLYLNRLNRLLEDVLAAQGDAGSVQPSIRGIIARALQLNASGLIVAHNHPSGRARPSEADRLLTRDLIRAARPLGLRLLDHVIVGGERTFSFADGGLLDELENA
ncbi:MAG: DNA repair protein RadC [Planctomycetes bacterium]|nr:DNA repair protein RadC [Planctomycetota bacterium]